MLKIDRQNKTFSTLATPGLAEVDILELGLQQYICNSHEAFFEEIGQKLFLIDKEVQPSDDVQDRIDILALDKEGNAVVIELKRGNNKLQMFQAISYAGMVASWEPSDFLQFLQGNRKAELEEFLEGKDIEEINRHQRLILVAEQFDYSVLIGAEWLNEKHAVDIICCRLSLAKDVANGAEFLVCSNVFPAPELAQQAIRRGPRRSGMSTPKWSSWEAALAPVTNKAVAEYFTNAVAARKEKDCYLRKRMLRFRIDGKIRLELLARRQNAYVWQIGRFDGDIDYWKAAISRPDLVKDVLDGRGLSFSVFTQKDIQVFHEAATQQLIAKQWSVVAEHDEEADGDEQGQLDDPEMLLPPVP